MVPNDSQCVQNSGYISGWGDGYYPTYFGYDSEGEVSGIYIQFIDIERTYTEENEA